MACRGKSFMSQLRGSSIVGTSRRMDFAAIDRYSTIRTFFRRQLSHHTYVPLRTGRSELLLSISVSLGRKPYSRSFHCSISRHNERPHEKTLTSTTGNNSSSPVPKQDDPPPPDTDPHRYDNYPRFFRRLAMSLPHLHRPTKDDLLNAAGGFWSRMRIRSRWIFLRSFRRYNADDISAFLTWLVVSQTLWLFIGT